MHDYGPRFVVYSDGLYVGCFRRWFDAYSLFVELLESYKKSNFDIVTSAIGLSWASDNLRHSLELVIFED